jgi:hypothetical protein
MIPTKIPVTWTKNEFVDLDYTRVPLRSSKTPLSMFTDSGHDFTKMTVDVYFDPNPFPSGIKKALDNFSYLKNIKLAVNRLPPGHYLPYHADGYDRYRMISNLSEHQSIIRAIVMAEDSLIGQYIHINDQVYHNWNAGDVFYWTNYDLHATYNFSTQNRYIFQITATL